MTRDEVIELVLTARSWEECLAAEEALLTWMSQHPNDYGVLDAGEQLTMIKEAIQEERRMTRKAAA